MLRIETLYRPNTVREASEILVRYQGSALLIAGGTDIVPAADEGKLKPKALVLVDGIDALGTIKSGSTGGVVIGAAVTLSELIRSPLVSPYRALKEAAATIGSVQIQNRGTLAGNICNASPAADTLPSLVVFNAQIVWVDSHGIENRTPIVDFITGPRKTVLELGDIVTGIILPQVPEGAVSAFARQTRRKAVDLAQVNAACLLFTDEAPRFSVGAVSPRPRRAFDIEEIFCDALTSMEEKKAKLAALELRSIAPISDIRASSEYRAAMARVLVMRCYRQAFEGMEKR